MIRRDKLGEGTYGIVYSAQSPSSDKQYALKRNLVEQNLSFAGSVRELDLLNRFRHHPHITRLEKVCLDNPFGHGLMSPLEVERHRNQKNSAIHFAFSQGSSDLHDLIFPYQQLTQLPPYDMRKRFMVHILLAVEHLHQHQVIHRDLKPGNVIVFLDQKDLSGQLGVAQVGDLGLSKPFTYQDEQTPEIVTSWYRAPEIAAGQQDYDYKIDSWSIGCLFFEIIARRAFLEGSAETSRAILLSIQRNLPEPVIPEKPSKRRRPRRRATFLEQLGLSSPGRKKFEQEAGSLTLFDDLLNKLLKYYPQNRYTVTQALDHPFFADQRELIQLVRTRYPATTIPVSLYVHRCVERSWMGEIVSSIYNRRREPATAKWYSDRVLFQAMDLYDRYLLVMSRTITPDPMAVESIHRGHIHDRFQAELRFYLCLYLAYKYFLSIVLPITYEELVPPAYQTESALLMAQQFEIAFIRDCLQYRIYRPTLYETADLFSDKLTDQDVRNLCLFYTINPYLSNKPVTEVYKFFRLNLRKSTIADLQVFQQPL